MVEIALKIVVVGDDAVGKTSIIIRYVKNNFTDDYKPTLGADFAFKEIKYNGISAKLNIWDIGGANQYKNLRKYYFEGTNVVLLVFDLTSGRTFENAINFWIEDLQNICNSVPIILVGNKSDLKTQRKISPDQIKNDTPNLIHFFIETSAKTGQNIEYLFQRVLTLL